MTTILMLEMLWKTQTHDSPENTTINIGSSHDLDPGLSTDEYVDILDSVHLTGILQNEGIQAWVRHTKTELQTRLKDTERAWYWEVL